MLVDFKDLAAPVVEGDLIVRRGKLFEIGEYPDKSFSLSAAEADAAIYAFTPGPLNIEHMPTIFDGKLGNVRKIWRDGNDINAEYAIPKWLHDVTQAEPIKISSEWNRTAKTAVGGALVLNPRVKDAAMMAAFSAVAGVDFASKGHADKMQRVHDSMCEMGAECMGKSYFREASDVAAFLDAEQLKTVQKMHDLTATFDDCCNRYESRNQLYSHYSDNQAHTQDAGKGKKSMFEGIRAALAKIGAPKEEIEAFCAEKPVEGKPANPVTVGMSTDDKARFTALETEVKAAREALTAQHTAAQFTTDTAAIETLVREFKLTPAEADGFKTVAKDTPAAFAAVLPVLQARPALPQLVSKDKTVSAGNTADATKLHEMARKRAGEDKVEYHVAFSAVCRENPDLAESVRAGEREDF